MTTILLPDQLDDFINLTLSNYQRGEWVDLSLSLQDYVFARRFMTKKKRKFDAGADYFRFKVQTTNLGTARNTEMYAIDQPQQKDLTTEAKVPWTKQDVVWSYDIDEPEFQTDRETIVEEVLIREHSAENSFFELMETNTWTAPSSSSQRPRSPFGIPYWIVKDTTTSGGFNGTNPSGFTSGAADLSSTTVPNWANWAGAYTAVTRDNLITYMETACDKTIFKSPRRFAALGGSVEEGDYEYFTTYRVVQPLRKILRAQNDDLGGDLNKYTEVMFRGNPVTWVPYLEANDTSDPVYGINFNVFFYYVKKGRDMMRHPPKQSPHQQTVREVYTTHWGNFACVNRRRLWVLSK